jgi:CheY-like chemotaxis protein
MQKKINSVVLADDDDDDCALFTEAIREFPQVHLTMVHDGDALLKLVNSSFDFPDILFLDLNMPRKNGFECLHEIKQSGKWKAVTIVIYSTSFNAAAADELYNSGADYFIQKPASFDHLKLLLKLALTTVERSLLENMSLHPSRDKFKLS